MSSLMISTKPQFLRTESMDLLDVMGLFDNLGDPSLEASLTSLLPINT